MSTLITRRPAPAPRLRVPAWWHDALARARRWRAERAARRELARRYDALRALDARTLRDIGAPEWVGGDARGRAIDRLRGLK